jgi:hypothetical protein
MRVKVAAANGDSVINHYWFILVKLKRKPKIYTPEPQ